MDYEIAEREGSSISRFYLDIFPNLANNHVMELQTGMLVCMAWYLNSLNGSFYTMFYEPILEMDEYDAEHGTAEGGNVYAPCRLCPGRGCYPDLAIV